MSEEKTLPSHMFVTLFSKPIFRWEFVPEERSEGHLLPAWKAELLLPGFCHPSTIARPRRDFTAPGLSHEQGRPGTASGRLRVWEAA